MGIQVNTRCILGWSITYEDLVSFVTSHGGKSCDDSDGDTNLCSCGERCWFRDCVESPFPRGIDVEYNTLGVEDISFGDCVLFLSLKSVEGVGMDEIQSKIDPELVEEGYELFLKINGHHEKKVKTLKQPKFYGIVHIC